MADDVRGATTIAREEIRLWPRGPARTLPCVGPELVFSPPEGVAAGTKMLRNVSEATLTVFTPDPGTANGCGVVVCPGGGWRILAWEHEGLDVAEWFAHRGFTAFLLKYRVRGTPADPAEFARASAAMQQQLSAPRPAAGAPRRMDQLLREESLQFAREIAADDGRRALQIARERAAEFGLKPERIGLIGFSAGAFLVADVAMDPQGAPPAFVAAIYGGDTQGRPVPPEAPPLFTVIAHDDRLLFRMVEQLYMDWTDAERSAELHIFARGQHGFGMVRQGLPSDRWIDLLGDWLADRGFG
ncbi:MAG: alpha/beta hydrolase fold domain-containing protein [Caulobacteraceae bacterium]|nr:alpha/beta hydrolase fold domain-containing protein [Caulobacteraceae bacterium]